ncbi:MAG: helix-turn-helix transcriptional regulator [Acidobacteriota bacterium]
MSLYKLLTSRKDIEIDFANLCLELRKAINITQTEMAEHLGITLRNYQRWEFGETNPHAKAAYRLAEMYVMLRIAGIVMLTNHKDREIDFAKLCLELGKAMKITQAEIAEHLGVPLREYRRWEAGEIQPPALAAYRLGEMDVMLRIIETPINSKKK